jgi:hypothetical protein
MSIRAIVATLCGLVAAVPASTVAQQVTMERGVRLAGLWCFPLASDTNAWVYLPGMARLARDVDNRPQFSFVRYVTEAPSDGADGSSGGITTARGGGVLHFLVEYLTPPESVTAAADALRRLAGDSAKLRGPIVFSAGRYTLVSSVLRADSTAGRQVLATGNAPVLEGNRIALSFDLSPQNASLLLASFRTATPDVSIVFDMTFSGLSAAYDADLDVNWSEVKHSMGLQAGGSIYFIGADVKLAFDEMLRNNAIHLTSRGTDATMENLLQVVYDKLLNLMFRPAEPEEVPAAQRGGLMDALAALTNTQGMANNARQFSGFGLYAGYRLQELKTSGHSFMSFNHRAAVDRHATIAFNIGNLYQRYGSDSLYFRTVNLLGEEFQQREVSVSVDGALAAELAHTINSVTVTMRKRHQNGHQTMHELVVDRRRIASDSTLPPLIYGWDGDSDRMAWLQYDVRTQWSFAGGGSYRTPWTTTDAPMINLYAPFARRAVQIIGDSATLAQQNVRAVTVAVAYPFFDGPRHEQLTVRVAAPAAEHQIDILLPRDAFAYDYNLTWQLSGGQRRTAHGRDSSGVIYIDELPPASPAPAPPNQAFELGNSSDTRGSSHEHAILLPFAGAARRRGL